MARRRPVPKRGAAPSLSPEQKRAWDAVQRFNAIKSTLTSFGRALTGNPRLTVEVGQNTETNGNKIWIRPPLSLGDHRVHDRELCDQRDENKMLLCTACRGQEETWQFLYHEMAHILLGSTTTRPSGDMIEEFCTRVIDVWHPTGACDHGPRIKRELAMTESYIGWAGAFHPFMTVLVKHLEDARIDSSFVKIKPGLKKVYYASMYNTMQNGTELPSGEVIRWIDSPLNAQIAIAMLIIGRGYQVKPGWVRPEAIDLVQDSELLKILGSIGGWTSVHHTASGAIDAFLRLNQMGLFEVPKCELPPPPPPPAPSDDDESGDDDEADESEDNDEQDDSDKESDKSGDNNFNNEGSSDDKSDAESDESDSSDDEGESSESDKTGGDSGDSDSDNTDSSPDGGDGLGDGDDAGSSDEEGSDSEQDATGDGTPGDTADDSAFDNQDDSVGGSDEEEGSSDNSSDDQSVSGDDGDDERSPDGSEGDSSNRDSDGSDESDGDGEHDQAGSDGSTEPQGEADAGDDDPQEGDQGDAESAASDESADTDVDASPQVGDGDVSGEPARPQDTAASEDYDNEDDRDAADAGDDIGTEGGEASDNAGAEGDDDDEEYLDDEGILSEHSMKEDAWEDDEDDKFDPQGYEMGTAEEIEAMLDEADIHENPLEAQLADEGDPSGAAATALDLAIKQSKFFDTSSVAVGGVIEYDFPARRVGWTKKYHMQPQDFMPAESILGRSLLIARRVFAENRRSTHDRNLKSGRVDSRMLGRRAGLGDDRLFKRKITPAKRDYVVGITIDCSGSNNSGNRMQRAKRAVMAKAELLHRLGIPFYITAHTGGDEEWFSGRGYRVGDEENEQQLMILWIKKLDEPWTNETRERLAAVQPMANNFDGHTLEFHRKLLSDVRATDKILIYYTDGAMPAANYEEELLILERELKACTAAGITRLAVGINTNSPSNFGFDTVQVDSDDDLMKVVKQLEKYLTA